MKQLARIIDRYDGHQKGTLVFAIGGMHGNEWAGVRAIETMFEMLEREPSVNPGFEFKGRLVGLRGNLQALAVNQRFIVKDLNRQWTNENVARLKNTHSENLDAEDKELLDLLTTIENEIQVYKAQKVILIDFHTTTARGGIFTIPTDDPESIQLAKGLHAPVIKGMINRMKGTTLNYFTTENMGIETVAICFESGQHKDVLSVNRAVAALTNCLRTIGCVKKEDVEHRHDFILREYSQGLPKVSELVTIHNILPGDFFKMEPNYKNFQHVRKGDVLAKDKKGEIIAKTDGRILMPLYQKKGNDGFFLIKDTGSKSKD